MLQDSTDVPGSVQLNYLFIVWSESHSHKQTADDTLSDSVMKKKEKSLVVTMTGLNFVIKLSLKVCCGKRF